MGNVTSDEAVRELFKEEDKEKILKIENGDNLTRLPISRLWRREMQSLQAYQKTSNLELGRTEVVHWSRSSNYERTLIASLSLVLVVELETGEAAEAEPTLATLKAVTEVVERVIVKVDEAVVEDVVHLEVLVARAGKRTRPWIQERL